MENRIIYLNSINYFRGIAILFIVAGHCISLGGWCIDSMWEEAIVNIIRGGTVFFVFISGFLFHHVFYKEFNYASFMEKKFKNVFIPYLTLSSIFIVYLVFIKQTGLHTVYTSGSKIMSIAFYYLTGTALGPYWYIPFIMIIFLLSPLFVLFIKINNKIKVILIFAFFAVSIFMHRPIDNVNVIQSVLYYLPVYLFGIWASMNKQYIYSKLCGKEIVLLSLVVALSLIQALLYDNYGNFHKDMFQISTIDILLPQKVMLCLFFMVHLRKYEACNIIPLNYLAKVSFAIYFIHPFLIKIFYKSKILLGMDHVALPHIGVLLTWVLFTILITCTSIIFAISIKKIFSKYSRQMIGC